MEVNYVANLQFQCLNIHSLFHSIFLLQTLLILEINEIFPQRSLLHNFPQQWSINI